MHIRLSATVVLTATLATPAIAQSLPTDVDLKATYCVPVIRRDLETLIPAEASARKDIEEMTKRSGVTDQQKQDGIAALRVFQRFVQDVQATQGRLRSFLLPKTSRLDIVPLEAALKRGEADAELLSARSAECATQCVPPSAPDCSSKCMGEDLMNRARDCRTAKWLPF